MAAFLRKLLRSICSPHLDCVRRYISCQRGEIPLISAHIRKQERSIVRSVVRVVPFEGVVAGRIRNVCNHRVENATIEIMSELVTVRGKAILFDMDGTLVDSTQVVEAAWGSWAARHDIPLHNVLSFSHGRPTIATLEHFLPGRDHSQELEELARFEETQTEGILAVPGAADVLYALQTQSHPWALVTSAWRKLAETRVGAAGLPLPTVIVPIDEIKNGKPDPEGFLHAAAQLGVAPQECIVFEDTRPGIDAGLSAGMRVVGLLTTCSSQQLRHRPLIVDFRSVKIRSDGDFLMIELRDQSQ